MITININPTVSDQIALGGSGLSHIYIDRTALVRDFRAYAGVDPDDELDVGQYYMFRKLTDPSVINPSFTKLQAKIHPHVTGDASS
jgi:hypothetical protein